MLITGLHYVQYCFARWQLSLSSVVVCNAASGLARHVGSQPLLGRSHGRSGDQHGTSSQYGYVLLGLHLVLIWKEHCLLLYVSSVLCVDVVIFVMHRAIALTVILARAGLGLDPVALRKLSFGVIRLAFSPCIVEAVTAAVASHFILGFPWLWGFMLGYVWLLGDLQVSDSYLVIRI